MTRLAVPAAESSVQGRSRETPERIQPRRVDPGGEGHPGDEGLDDGVVDEHPHGDDAVLVDGHDPGALGGVRARQEAAAAPVEDDVDLGVATRRSEQVQDRVLLPVRGRPQDEVDARTALEAHRELEVELVTRQQPDDVARARGSGPGHRPDRPGGRRPPSPAPGRGSHSARW